VTHKNAATNITILDRDCCRGFLNRILRYQHQIDSGRGTPVKTPDDGTELKKYQL